MVTGHLFAWCIISGVMLVVVVVVMIVFSDIAFWVSKGKVWDVHVEKLTLMTDDRGTRHQIRFCKRFWYMEMGDVRDEKYFTKYLMLLMYKFETRLIFFKMAIIL